MDRFSLKGKIASGEPIIGTWNTFGSTIATKVLASSGLDFQIIDFEHGPFQIAEVHDHIASSMLYDCSCLVRIPSNQDWMALQALDQGAEGILVPHIHNLKSAQNASQKASQRRPGRPKRAQRRPEGARECQRNVQAAQSSIYSCFIAFSSDPGHPGECAVEP